jgi:hypothetical protein
MPNNRGMSVNCDPQFAMQVWTGSNYRTSDMFDDFDLANKDLERHKRSMPNCPARVVKLQVVAEHNPEKVYG